MGYFFAVMLLFSFGASISRSIGMALLIQHLTGEKLPYIFMLIDILAMFSFFAYAHYSKRLSELRLLSFLFAISSVFILISISLFSIDIFWVYAVFFVGFFLSYILLSIHLTTVVAAYFSGVQMKRVTGIINTGLPIGGILGGACLLGLLPITPNPAWLLVLTPLAYIFALFLIKKIDQRLIPVRSTHNRFSQNHSALQEFKSAARYIVRSPLMIYMTLGMIFFVIASKFLEYQYQALIYPAEFPDIADRASFFAIYEFFGNLAWLFIQVFVTSRVLPKFGVGVSNLIHPILMAIIAVGLFFRFGFITGVIAQFINQEMRGALRTPAFNLLFNAVPPNMWGACKAFLNGIVFPFATIVASLSIIVMYDYVDEVDVSYYLSLFAFILAVLAVLTAIPQWLAYNQGVFGLLNHGLFTGKKQLAKEKALLAMVAEKLDSDKSKEVIAALEMIRLLKADDFIEAMGGLLQRDNQPDNIAIKRYCIDTLGSLPSNNLIDTQISQALRYEHDPHILALLIKVLPHTDKKMMLEIESFLDHSVAEVFVASSLFLYHDPNYQHKFALEKRLLIRIHHPNLPGLAHYLYALGEFGQLSKNDYRSILANFLGDARDDVCFAAFVAHIKVLKGQHNEYKAHFIKVLNHPHKKMQLAALSALHHCSPMIDWQPLIDLLANSDRHLVEKSKNLFQIYIYEAKPSLIDSFFNKKTSVEQSFEILDLVYLLFNQQQQVAFQKTAMDRLKNYIYTESLSLLFAQNEPKHETRALILKILQEISDEYLQRVLVAITYFNRENREFFQRLSRGLLSSSKANQGNALEVLSNLNDKRLAQALIYYFDNQTQDMRRLRQIYQYLFQHKLPVDADNYRDHIFDINHHLLRACLHYSEIHQQDQDPWQKNDKVKALLYAE